ncbi:helix-turn-helix domain-containing protein [Pseudomonas fluorescens]|uniref:helix-turn-helix domain-containing protein n=1 Tax=Pseudomonas fluorescens TaxID=294 RepID=UPI00123F722F
MNRIRQIREQSGISQAVLYRKLGWKQSRLANYEAGNRTPSLSDAREIVAALNILSVACHLEDVFPESLASQATPRAVTPSTLNQTIRRLDTFRQCVDSAVNPSSEGAAAKLAPPEALAS